jgi:hypothetical protein
MMKHRMSGRTILGSASALGLAAALATLLVAAHGATRPALAGPADASALAATSDTNVQSLVDRGLAGPAGPDDEGQYKLVDPIGPGGATSNSAMDEVYASTMVGGVYTKWQPYHDPFTGGGSYGHRDFGRTLP